MACTFIPAWSRLQQTESPGALRRGSRAVSRGVHGVGEWHLLPVGGLERPTVFAYSLVQRTT
jgi:hypothetical protein